MCAFYWSMLCFILALTILTSCSEKPCSISRLSSLVLSKCTGNCDVECEHYSFCTTSISHTNLHISDASLTISNYFKNTSAVIPSSFSTILVTDDVNNLVTIFDFFTRPQLLELSMLLAKALMELVNQFNWTRITIIADASHVFYLHTAELFYTMSPSTSKLHFLQVGEREINEDDALKEIERLNMNIVVLSLRSSAVESILRKRLASKLKWPKHAWIMHSVKTSDLETLEGVIDLQVKQGNSVLSSQTDNFTNKTTEIRHSCNNLSCVVRDSVDIYQWIKQKPVFLSNYSAQGLGPVAFGSQVPSDLPPQYVATTFIILCYLGIGICFTVVTITMTMYIYFRNKPAIKATSVSLSMLIFIGCYAMMIYLLVINSFLLPSYQQQSHTFRTFICVFRIWLNGLGYPIALIMSTLLVKHLRVYRIFYCQGKISKYTSSNTALTIYSLLLTSPNALICLIWSSSDPYISKSNKSINDGYLFVAEVCVSKYYDQWLICLFIYLVFISIALVITAILTRKVKQRNFKDTKKLTALSFTFVLTITIILSFLYTFRIIDANRILIIAVLQLGHYMMIFECLGFLFVPKLYPILKEQLLNNLGASNQNPTIITTRTSS